MPSSAASALLEIAPNHWTLNKRYPLYKTIMTLAAFKTLPVSHKKVKKLYDVNSITENPVLFRNIMDFLADRYRSMRDQGPTHVLGIDSRGYIFGAPLAIALGLPFVPMRRMNVLETSFVGDGDDQERPVPPMSVRGDSINAASRVLIVDDFIDGGDTAIAAIECAQIVSAKVVEMVVMCDMKESGGVEKIHKHPGFKDIRVVSLFRLRNALDAVVFEKVKKASKL